MVHPNALLQHLAQAQNLGQVPVAALQPGEAPLAEHVDLALLGWAGHVKGGKGVRQAVAALLGETEDDDG